MRHEPCSAAEVFVGNLPTGTPLDALRAAVPSIRFGDVALDIDGDELPSWEMRPVFIARAEQPAYDRLMMARLSAIRTGAAR